MIRFHPLATAALAGALLVGAGCSPAPDDEQVMPPLLKAADDGDVRVLSALLDEHADVDVRDLCRWTPLMKAALKGHREAVERLLAFGAEVDAADKGGYTAMMLAASNDHADVVEILLTNGAFIDRAEVTNGWTALIWAAKQGHLETVTRLLAYGADPAVRDHQGLTARDWASAEHQNAVVAALEHGQ